MFMMENFDYIIIGSGCAGLSLAYHLVGSEKLAQKRVLLLDSDHKITNDKTWCFWSKDKYPYKSAQKVFWNKFEFKADDLEILRELKGNNYCYINSLDFYSEVTDKLSGFENFVIKTEPVRQIKDENHKVYVSTDTNTYTSDLAFNSVISLLDEIPPQPKLLQHFYGKRIRTKNSLFRNSNVKLMDFSFPNRDSVQFGYLLPFSENEALIEYTEFSRCLRTDEEYEELLNAYLTDIGVIDYQIIEHEKGQIPMSDYLFPKFNSRRVINLGTAGGFTKPTTGYTFKNIQSDVVSIVLALEQDKPFKRKHSPARFRFYDKLLLGIILNNPEKVKPIMTRLFRYNSINSILNFLDEKTGIIDEVKIFLKLPWAPFLKQLFLK